MSEATNQTLEQEARALAKAVFDFHRERTGEAYLRMMDRAAALDLRPVEPADDPATLRQHAEQLAAALIKVEWAQQMTRLKNGGTIYTAITCPCCGGEKDPPPGRAAHRAPPAGHTAECELARVLQAWREGPGAGKGGGNG